MRIALYTLRCHHRADGHIHRWHLATPPGYRSRAGDSPASVTWLPLVAERPSVTVMAAGGSDGSRAAVDDLRLINTRPHDGLPRHASVYDETAGLWLRVALGVRPLNPLLTDYVVQSITEREIGQGAAFASAITVWQAKAGILDPARTELRLPVHDRLLDFDTPVQTARYAGTGGTEGPAELADVTKERCFGWCPIVSPTYLGVIAGKHSYSVNGGQPVEAVLRGWDRAVPLELVTGTPGAGQFRADLATGLLTIGGSKPEDFRVEVKGTKAGGVWPHSIGAVIAHLATGSGLVSTVDVAGIDAVPRTVGVYLPSGDATTHRDLYDRLTGSVPRGRWYIDLADRLVATRLPRPEDSTPAAAYRQRAGETPGLVPAARGAVAPAKQVVVRYAPNPSPADQTAAAAGAADVALWTKPWREAASATDATVAAAWGTSARVEHVETALTQAADAVAEAAAWAEELADPPRAYELKVRDGAPGLWIGDGVTVTDDLAGFETGGPVVIIGRSNRDRGGGATLYVEG